MGAWMVQGRIASPFNRKGRVVITAGVARAIDDYGNIFGRLDAPTVSETVPNREWVLAGTNPDGRAEAWEVLADCNCGH